MNDNSVVFKIQTFISILLLFCVIFDPTNQFLKIKIFVFILFLIINLKSVSFTYLPVILIFLFIFFASLFFALITGQSIDFSRTLIILKAFFYLAYILYMKDTKLKNFKYFYYLTLLLSCFVIIIWILIFSFPILMTAVYAFVKAHNHFMMISKRTFYGIRLYQVFYRTSPLCVISFSVALLKYLREKNMKFLIHSLLFFFGLFCSGTRANILAVCLLLVSIFFIYKFYIKKEMLFSVSGFLLFSCLSLIVIIALLVEKEDSAIVKAGRLSSYLKLFASAPMRFLLRGSGPGSLFYSRGVFDYIAYSELTYFDFIKDFGLLFTIILLFCFLYPILKCALSVRYDTSQKYCLCLSWVAYLFIAGTNPLLISSTGLVAYSIMFYAYSSNIFSEISFISKKDKLFFNKSKRCI